MLLADRRHPPTVTGGPTVLQDNETKKRRIKMDEEKEVTKSNNITHCESIAVQEEEFHQAVDSIQAFLATVIGQVASYASKNEHRRDDLYEMTKIIISARQHCIHIGSGRALPLPG